MQKTCKQAGMAESPTYMYTCIHTNSGAMKYGVPMHPIRLVGTSPKSVTCMYVCGVYVYVYIYMYAQKGKLTYFASSPKPVSCMYVCVSICTCMHIKIFGLVCASQKSVTCVYVCV